MLEEKFSVLTIDYSVTYSLHICGFYCVEVTVTYALFVEFLKNNFFLFLKLYFGAVLGSQ